MVVVVMLVLVVLVERRDEGRKQGGPEGGLGLANAAF